MEFRKRECIWLGVGACIILAVGALCVKYESSKMMDVDSENAPQAEQSQEITWSVENSEAVNDSEKADCAGIEYGEPEDMTLEETLESLRPTAVQLYCETETGGHISASGFLMEITEKSVYICTNRHVIEDYDKWQVYFFDGTQAEGTKIGVSEQYDVGVVEVLTETISDETLQTFMTVHVDVDYWETLGVEEQDVGLVRVGREGDVLYALTGTLMRKEIDFPWGNGEKESELSIALSAGDSGSAVFDRKGYLICMVMGISTDIGGNRYWGIPLDALVSCYQEITGRELSVN